MHHCHVFPNSNIKLQAQRLFQTNGSVQGTSVCDGQQTLLSTKAEQIHTEQQLACNKFVK